MSMKYIRKTYGVPAKRGGRVRYTGERRPEYGTILSAKDGQLHIRLDTANRSGFFHPAWKLEYL